MSKTMKNDAKLYIEEVRSQFLKKLELGDKGFFGDRSSEYITKVAKYWTEFMKVGTDIGYSKKNCNIISKGCKFMSEIGIDNSNESHNHTHIIMIKKYGFMNYHIASSYTLWPADIWDAFIEQSWPTL